MSEIQGAEHEKPPRMPSFAEAEASEPIRAAVAAYDAKQRKANKPKPKKEIKISVTVRGNTVESTEKESSPSKEGRGEWVGVSFWFGTEIIPSDADELWAQLKKTLGVTRDRYSLLNFDTLLPAALIRPRMYLICQEKEAVTVEDPATLHSPREAQAVRRGEAPTPQGSSAPSTPSRPATAPNSNESTPSSWKKPDLAASPSNGSAEGAGTPTPGLNRRGPALTPTPSIFEAHTELARLSDMNRELWKQVEAMKRTQAILAVGLAVSAGIVLLSLLRRR